MAWLDKLLVKVRDAGASDLHFSSDLVPMYRVDGTMRPIEGHPVTTPEDVRKHLKEIAPELNWNEFCEIHDTDFAYPLEGVGRFRANYFEELRGCGAVLRLIPSKIPTPEELNLPKAMLDLCTLHKGLVLVTGPTGSGKSTTLAAMMDQVNRTREEHIITIEDPVEFVYTNKKCLVNQREVHRHTESFKKALRAALREDPDIVLVGELRDLETVEIAIETAETGHLVFGTLHTTTAASTVNRIVDQFPADRQRQIRTMLADSLRGVISQTLCKRIGKGRIAAMEILLVNSAISANIRDGKTHQIPSSIQMGRAQGMQALNDALLSHVLSGIITPEEGMVRSVDRHDMRTKLNHSGLKAPTPHDPMEEK
jgi:twitching motility protein PilT